MADQDNVFRLAVPLIRNPRMSGAPPGRRGVRLRSLHETAPSSWRFRRSSDRHNLQPRNHTRAVSCGLRRCARLDAVVSVFRDEPLHPCRVIAVKDSVFGTPHNQTVDLDSLLLADSPPTAMKIGEREVGEILVKSYVRPDPNCQIWCERYDAVNDKPVPRLFDRRWKVAREERALVEAIEQDVPPGIS